VPSAGLEVQKYLKGFVTQAGDLTMIGILFLFGSSMALFHTVEVTFNRIWGVKSVRSLINSAALYIAVLTMVPLLMGISFAVTSYIWALPILQKTESYFLNIAPLIFTWICFTVFYVWIPNCKVLFRHGLLGGFIAAVLFEIAKILFAQYVAGINFNALIYGTFATIPLFLFWLYISWVIILFGAQIVSAVGFYRFEAEYSSEWAFIQAYKWLAIIWQSKKPLSVIELFKLEGRLTHTQPYEQLEVLEKNNWIKKVTPNNYTGNYVLARDLSKLNIYDFYRLLPWRLPNPDLLVKKINQSDQILTVLYQQLKNVEETVDKSSLDNFKTLFTAHLTS
jgi:membrane protein